MLRSCCQNAASRSATKRSSNGRYGLARRLRETFAHAGLAHMDSGIWTRCSSQLAESGCICGELSTLRARQESTFGTTAFYVTNTGTLAAQYQILPKVTLTARVGGGINDYSTKQTADGKTDFRHDSFILAGAQADYEIQQWLRVGLEYLRISRDSNFPSFRFVDDRITSRATVQF